MLKLKHKNGRPRSRLKRQSPEEWRASHRLGCIVLLAYYAAVFLIGVAVILFNVGGL